MLALGLAMGAMSAGAAEAAEPAAKTEAGTEASAPAAARERLPFKVEPENSTAGSVMRVVFTFGVVVVIGLAVVIMIKRWLPGVYGQYSAGGRRIEVLEIRRLTPKTALFLVEVDGTRLLLGQSADKLVPLKRWISTAAKDASSSPGS